MLLLIEAAPLLFEEGLNKNCKLAAPLGNPDLTFEHFRVMFILIVGYKPRRVFSPNASVVLRRLGIMSVLPEEKVLRINCPGFGVSTILPLGEAKPLAMYDVIVVNPTSVLHLFDNKSETLKQVEVLQADGMTSYRAEDDSIIESLSAELDLRSSELNQFLKKGGLLVYFLTAPFTIQGPKETMDNYSWLGEWSPDKPSGPNQRNMSATIRGKAVETSADAARSVWVPYLKQTGIEWSTIIRQENLTEGYVPLATAGPNKCIAGFKSSGPKAGQVVFLPAPYDKAFDAKLKECLDRWFDLHNDESAAPSALQDLSKGLASLLSDDEPAANKVEAAKAEPVEAAPVAAHEPVAAEPEAVKAEATPEPMMEAPSGEPKFFDFEKNGHGSSSEVHNEPPSEAQDLIKKMQNEVIKPAVPDWCSKFSFEELDGLRQEHTDLNEEIRLANIKAQHLAMRIEQMEDLKNSLLSASGEHLMTAVSKVFERLGWLVKPALGNADELWLVEDDKTQAIVRLNYSTEQPNRSELASLAESVITYWGAHEVEPKGILVASTWADRSPQDRPEEDYPDSMNDFAKRKNLCLLTTSQLLSIYRDLDVLQTEPKDIRDNLLTTSGRVNDFLFNKKNTTKMART